MDLNDFLVLFCDAMIDECSEIKDLCNWKPWKKNRPINTYAVEEEAIDVLHFLLDMFNKLGMTYIDIVEMYEEKFQVNMDRIRDDY